MRRAYLLPAAILLGILALSLWNGRTLGEMCEARSNEVRLAQRLAEADDWDGAIRTLGASYAAWSDAQAYLHVVGHHGTIGSAESLYRRALTLADERDRAAFRAELSELANCLQLLTEMEKLRLQSVF
ncbi:MAG: DUF4363 family protein [Oscillibacter sp.]|nr:DUF4363 family protein [Oscillibacter sp.]